MKNGAYAYYQPNAEKPVVVEVDGDRVWMAGDGESVLLRKCSGRFVPLIEAPDAAAVSKRNESAAQEASDAAAPYLPYLMAWNSTGTLPMPGPPASEPLNAGYGDGKASEPVVRGGDEP